MRRDRVLAIQVGLWLLLGWDIHPAQLQRCPLTSVFHGGEETSHEFS